MRTGQQIFRINLVLTARGANVIAILPRNIARRFIVADSEVLVSGGVDKRRAGNGSTAQARGVFPDHLGEVAIRLEATTRVGLAVFTDVGTALVIKGCEKLLNVFRRITSGDVLTVATSTIFLAMAINAAACVLTSDRRQFRVPLERGSTMFGTALVMVVGGNLLVAAVNEVNGLRVFLLLWLFIFSLRLLLRLLLYWLFNISLRLFLWLFLRLLLHPNILMLSRRDFRFSDRVRAWRFLSVDSVYNWGRSGFVTVHSHDFSDVVILVDMTGCSKCTSCEESRYDGGVMHRCRFES